MGFYNRFILPKMVQIACSSKPTMRQREKVVPLASGRVLEIGVGTGLNLPYYDRTRIEKVWGLDPSREMVQRAQSEAEKLSFDIEFLKLPVEEIPLEDNSMDSIVITYTLCSIGDPIQALSQMKRVLKPGGSVIFCEHGMAPDPSTQRWQKIINPVWKRLGGGCHLNRNIPSLFEEAGFNISTLQEQYIPGWKPASYNYWGQATCLKL